MDNISDKWQTPQWLFNELNLEFNFDIDLCATADNTKCDRFYFDYFSNKIHNKGDHTGDATGYWWSLEGHNNPLSCHKLNCAFMNPPYSNPKPFIEKAWEDSKYCKIVCLVKCDPSTKWWATFWEYGVECPCIQFGVEANDPDICLGCNNKGRYNGPKPGCEVRFFPKRIQFDPPIELVESGDVCPIGVKWCSKCVDEEGGATSN